MTDIIVILVIAVVVLLGVKSTIKHFKGEGACCGGGGGSLPPEEKKLENPVIGKKTVKISGMHCECSDRSHQQDRRRIRQGQPARQKSRSQLRPGTG